jgi:hypothetical protein
MTERDRDLERLLRAALREQADRQHPAGDGLVRIRARVAARRRWRVWLTPTLALAGAAAVIAAAVAAPIYLTGSGSERRMLQPGAQPTSPPPATGQASPSPAQPPYGSLGTPYGGDGRLKDMVTVWPYSSRRTASERADRDVQHGTYPRLADAAATAVDFVAAFVGDDQGLSARKYDAYPPGVRELVVRKTDNGEVPVSLVYLVRVRVADDAPYVVAGASRAGISDRDSLTISKLPRVVGTNAFTARGITRPLNGVADRTVIVQLREPGSTEVLAQQSAPVRLTGDAEQYWTADLTPLHALSSTGVVAAWTLDDAGRVVEFVAAPTAAR